MLPTTLTIKVENLNNDGIQGANIELIGHSEDSTYVKDLSTYDLSGTTDENGFFTLDLSEFYAGEVNNGFTTLKIRSIYSNDTVFGYITLEEEKADTVLITHG